MEKIKKSNSGVSCDVCDCFYNSDGCNCALETIKVTGGNNKGSHFCKSYCCK